MELGGHGSTTVVVTGAKDDFSSRRGCEQAQAMRNEHAKLCARAIGWRWIGGGEFGLMSRAMPVAGKIEKREGIGSAVLLMVRARREESPAPA